LLSQADWTINKLAYLAKPFLKQNLHRQIFFAKLLATATHSELALAALGNSTQNRIISICVKSPKVAKAST
jgi:hypothetical protein